MSMGTPVICFDIPNSGVGSLNINMSTGIVIRQSSNNVEKLKLISKLLNNKNLLDKMRINSLNRSKDFHINSHILDIRNF